MKESTSTCPKCSKPASGAFCQHCGAQLASKYCTQCGADLPPGGGFCVACGTPVGTGRGLTAKRSLIAPAAFLVVALAVALFFVSRMNREAPAAGGAGSGPVAGAIAPDFSQMLPRERFDGLYNMVMQAAEAGDVANMEQFTPMALLAYENLDEVDADARYHVALLKLHSGDVPGTIALADSILAESPNHLFGFVVRGTVAKWQQDNATLAANYRAFLEAYEQELAAGRPEYGHHQPVIERFRAEADSATGA